MRIFRSALIVLLLLLAQVTALAHALEHLRADEAGHSAHMVCGQCLAAQGLDTALVSTPVLPPLCSAAEVFSALVVFYSAEVLLDLRHARGPPVS